MSKFKILFFLKHSLVEFNRAMFFCYIICLPFLFFNLFPSMDSLTYPINFYITLITLLPFLIELILIDRYKPSSFFFVELTVLIIVFMISLLISTVISKQFDGYYGTSPLITNVKRSILLFHFAYVCFYVYISFKKMNANIFFSAFFASLIAVCLIGVVQVGIINGVSFLVPINSFFSLSGLVRDSNYFINFGKVALTAPEPAWTAGFSLVYLFPVSIFYFFFKKNSSKINRISLLILLPILFLLLLLTYSTQVYASIFFSLGIVLLFYVINGLKKKKYIGPVLMLGIILSLIIIFFINGTIQRVFIDKIFSEANYSTAFRMTSVYNGFLVFLQQPIFGVGAGGNGYFYFNNIINTWMVRSFETRQQLLGINGVPSFAPTIPYLLSNYGFVGCTLLFTPIIIKYRSKYKTLPIELKLLSIIPLIIYGFMAIFTESFIGNYYLPLVAIYPVIFSQSNKLFCDNENGSNVPEEEKKQKSILVVSTNYFPEQFSITSVCEELVNVGYSVTVITGKPNYGYGRILEGYEKVDKEIINNVKVLRVNIKPRTQGIIGLIKNYLSIYVEFNKYLSKHNEKYDVVMSHVGSPIFSIRGVGKFCKKHNTPHIHYGLDIWPESLVATSYFKRRSLGFQIMKLYSKKIYESADVISFASPSVETYLKDYLNINPNIPFVHIYQPSLSSVPKMDVVIDHNYCINNTVHILYCGSVARFHRLDLFVRALKHFVDTHIQPVVVNIVGSGSELDKIKDLVSSLHLDDVIIFHGRVPIELTKTFYQEADVLYVPLEDTCATSKMIPQKLIEYFMYARPILGMIQGDGKQLLVDACEDNILVDQTVESISNGIERIVTSKETFAATGLQNRMFFDQSEGFQLRFIVNQFNEIIQKLIKNS